MPTFRSTRKGKKCFLWWAYVCQTRRCYTTSHLHEVFFDFARIFSLFSFVFRTSNFWSLRNLIKQLFHSRLLDMRLVIANSYPTRTHGIIVKYLYYLYIYIHEILLKSYCMLCCISISNLNRNLEGPGDVQRTRDNCPLHRAIQLSWPPPEGIH